MEFLRLSSDMRLELKSKEPRKLPETDRTLRGGVKTFLQSLGLAARGIRGNVSLTDLGGSETLLLLALTRLLFPTVVSSFEMNCCCLCLNLMHSHLFWTGNGENCLLPLRVNDWT